jgi:hypothetical protein
MTISEFLIFGLATWRLASLLVNEAGPFDMFIRLRERVGIQHQDGVAYLIPDGFLPGVLSCVWCSSVWCAALFVLAWLILPTVALPVALVFAFSAVAVIVETFVRR